jgi:hypothetical protein
MRTDNHHNAREAAAKMIDKEIDRLLKTDAAAQYLGIIDEEVPMLDSTIVRRMDFERISRWQAIGNAIAALMRPFTMLSVPSTPQPSFLLIEEEYEGIPFVQS